MAVFKCKICGGSLEIEPSQSIATCEYCGTKQTLPKLSDERRANLYDRAGHFRRNNDFDKAVGIFEQILNDDPTDAEAYWSLVLCRYGIEYVKDPATGRRLPTVNRAQYTSVFDDEDYKSAIAHADAGSRALYEAEAAVINELQKDILAISQKEEPFDVFICYKETDQGGRRTRDSVIATDLYQELTREGFKVFFSRITLEDKLGSAYEPYIFAALQSAKVMVVLGTEAAHFNAAWVKNEWSRYLSLIKNGARKTLIPAYRDMDPYDLPEEFSHLQAQDMSRLGFMQDLVRGIKKLVGASAQKTAPAGAPFAAEPAGNINALLRRAALSLEDGDFEEADDFCEQVLNQDPENGTAYLYKLMAELEVSTPEELGNHTADFEQSNNYHRALRFGDNKLKAELEGYVTATTKKHENELLNKAQHVLANVSYEDPRESLRDIRSLIEFLQSLQHRPEGVALLRDCHETIERLNHEMERQEDEALKWKLERAMQSINETENPIYALDEAKELLQRLQKLAHKSYAAELIPTCEKKIEKLKEALRQKAAVAKETARKRKRLFIILSSTYAAVLLCIALVVMVIIPAIQVSNAENLIENGQDAEAELCLLDSNLMKTFRQDEWYSMMDGILLRFSNQIDELIRKGDYEAACDLYTQMNRDIPSALQQACQGIYGEIANNYNLTEAIVPAGTTTIADFAYKNCTSLQKIIIPDSVTTIGASAFEGCSGLSEITIPNNVISIGEKAFSGCSGLSEIAIPNNVISIGEKAFSGCSGLAEISLPSSVTSIGFAAFSGCSNLQSITLPFIGESAKTSDDTYQYPFGYIFGSTSYSNSIKIQQFYIGNNTSEEESSTYYIPNALKSVTIAGGNVLFGAFYNCKTLVSITLPQNIVKIGDAAFYNCDGLTSITIPSSVTSIGNNAFRNCNKICSIVVPSGVTSIGSYTFSGCSSLTEFIVPSSVTSIGKSAFARCDSLQSISLPFIGDSSNGSNSHFGYIFGATEAAANKDCVPISLKSVIILNGSSVSEKAFIGCNCISTISLPESITRIGASAFSGCSSLKQISIPKNVTSIGASAFSGCSNLKQISIPKNVTSIGASAFSGCGILSQIIIPENVTVIEDSVFQKCYSLSEITLPISITSIGHKAFFECNKLTAITIPSNVTSIGHSAFYGCYQLTSITIPANVTEIGYQAFFNCSGLTTVNFESNCKLTTISDEIFAFCHKLSLCELPASIEKIGYGAFFGCVSLSSMDIPNKVKSIGHETFRDCTNLVAITFPASVTSIGQRAFYNCNSLITVHFAGNSQLTSIDQYAFESCDNLTTITIPANIKNIGYCAFDNCNKLAVVYYEGESSSWKNISISSNNSVLASATRYYYSAEQPTIKGNYWHYDADGNIVVW